MDSPVVKKILLALAILLTIGVVAYAVSTYNKTKPMEKASDQTLNTITQNLSSNEFDRIDKQTISGSEVIGLINTKATTEVKVVVKTKKNTTGVTYTSPSYSITDINNGDFVEPTAPFKVEVSKTENGTVNLLTLTQQ